MPSTKFQLNHLSRHGTGSFTVDISASNRVVFVECLHELANALLDEAQEHLEYHLAGIDEAIEKIKDEEFIEYCRTGRFPE